MKLRTYRDQMKFIWLYFIANLPVRNIPFWTKLLSPLLQIPSIPLQRSKDTQEGRI